VPLPEPLAPPLVVPLLLPAPVVPDEPDEPDMPDDPDEPDEPDMPDDPDEPDMPVPDEPFMPDPDEPDEPEEPDDPDDPEDPVLPDRFDFDVPLRCVPFWGSVVCPVADEPPCELDPDVPLCMPEPEAPPVLEPEPDMPLVPLAPPVLEPVPLVLLLPLAVPAPAPVPVPLPLVVVWATVRLVIAARMVAAMIDLRMIFLLSFRVRCQRRFKPRHASLLRPAFCHISGLIPCQSDRTYMNSCHQLQSPPTQDRHEKGRHAPPFLRFIMPGSRRLIALP
jgi:hypothetical protein